MSSFLHDIAPQSLASSLPLPSTSASAWSARAASAASVSPREDAVAVIQAENNLRRNQNDLPSAPYMLSGAKPSNAPSTSASTWGARVASVSPREDAVAVIQAENNLRRNLNDLPSTSYVLSGTRPSNMPSTSASTWGARATIDSPREDAVAVTQAENNLRRNLNDLPSTSYSLSGARPSNTIPSPIARPSTSAASLLPSNSPYDWPPISINPRFAFNQNGSPPSVAYIICSRCEQNQPTTRCLECNDLFCHVCCHAADSICQMRVHHLHPINRNISPIGVRPNTVNSDRTCEIHGRDNEFYCEQCVTFICTLCRNAHQLHRYTSIQSAVETYRERVFAIIDKNRESTIVIRNSIDQTEVNANAFEKHIAEINLQIRRTMRDFKETIENRERHLLQKLEQMRQCKILEMNEQMSFLRDVLIRLTQLNDELVNSVNFNDIELFLTKEKCQAELDYYTFILKNTVVQEPKVIITPNFDLFNQLNMECEPQFAPEVVSSDTIKAQKLRQSFVKSLQSVRLSPPYNMSPSSNLRAITDRVTPRVIGVGQAISGNRSQVQVVMTSNLMLGMPTLSFCADGQEDGKVCRPWGICVDRIGNIIVADRRNNRIQMFNSEGRFLIKFGSKGSEVGQFELPAGITTDIYGRILVVDKDNHRVQIFTGYGEFVLAFGSQGQADGQFQYPWDLAVNSRGNIVVGDTRNHRIQKFTSAGVHIASFRFREDRSMPKGRTSPRGVCFTNTGNIVVSDFENHRLLVIDSTLSTILYSTGREGFGIGELNRPSGMVTADNGWIIVTDSKNHRLVIYKSDLNVVTTVDLRSPGFSDKDRPCNVALAPNGRTVVLFETLPESRDKNAKAAVIVNPYPTIKEYIKVY